MDIYKQYINKNASDKTTVNVGRISAAVALIIACIMAPLLGGIDQAFQFIQEYTGIVSPGILAVFMLGLFWKKTTNKGAIIGALASIPIAVAFKFTDMPFMNQMGLTAVLTMVVIVLVSLYQNRRIFGVKADDPYIFQIITKYIDDKKGIEISKKLFETSPLFNIGAFAVMLVLVALYAMFWN